MLKNFNKLCNVILESTDDSLYEDKTILLIPGSFKPPCKNDWNIVDKFKNDYDKVIFMISNVSEKTNLSRKLSLSNLIQLGKIKEFYEANLKNDENFSSILDNVFSVISDHTDSLTYNELTDVFMKAKSSCMKDSSNDDKLNEFFLMIDEYLSEVKERLMSSVKKTSSGKEMTPEISKFIFDLFIKSSNLQEKVEAFISNSPSPITDIKAFISRCRNCNISIFSFDEDKSKYDFAKDSKYNTVSIISLQEYHQDINSNIIRNSGNSIKREWFPECISDEDFEKIEKILSK